MCQLEIILPLLFSTHIKTLPFPQSTHFPSVPFQMVSEKVGGAEGTKLDEDFRDLERVREPGCRHGQFSIEETNKVKLHCCCCCASFPVYIENVRKVLLLLLLSILFYVCYGVLTCVYSLCFVESRCDQ